MVALGMLIAAGLFFLLAAHPFTTYPLSLRLFAARRDPPLKAAPDSPKPSVAICMSAFNEEAVIVAKVESLLTMASAYGPATLHIYVDGAADRTAELLAPYGDRADIVVSSERKGKTHGLNTLVDRSKGELLLFTDANVTGDVSALERLAAVFADASVGCATAQLSYTNNDESAASKISGTYWSIEERVKEIESRTIGVIGVDGAMFMLRRALHRPPPGTLIDDLYLTLNVLIDGFRVIRVDEVLVHERNATRMGEEFRRKARIACQAVNVHRALWPRLRTLPPAQFYGYMSHRFIKWMMPFLILAGVLCSISALALVVPLVDLALILALLALLIGAGAWLRFGPAANLVSVTVNLAGVGLGVLQSLSGRQTYTVWSPASSIRSGMG